MSAKTTPGLRRDGGTTVVAAAVPAQARSGSYGGGKVCYTIVGKPYVDTGRGRCPMS